jgi:hypothetical protein
MKRLLKAWDRSSINLFEVNRNKCPYKLYLINYIYTQLQFIIARIFLKHFKAEMEFAAKRIFAVGSMAEIAIHCLKLRFTSYTTALMHSDDF